MSKRPAYESEKDREKELAVARALETDSTKLLPMPSFCRTDFLVVKNTKAIGVMEIKCRDIARTDYPTVILSLHKWMNGVAYHQVGFEFWVAFAMYDGVYLYEYSPLHSVGKLNVEMGGRAKTRRDLKDVEPVVHIPADWLKLASGFVHTEDQNGKA